jgi:hypothetical protein
VKNMQYQKEIIPYRFVAVPVIDRNITLLDTVHCLSCTYSDTIISSWIAFHQIRQFRALAEPINMFVFFQYVYVFCNRASSSSWGGGGVFM